MFVLLFTRPKLTRDMPCLRFTPQHILVYDQPFQSDRTPCMYPPRADPYLRAKAIPEPIRKACASIHEGPAGIDASAEHRRGGIGFSDDGVGVVGGVGVDELDGGLQRGKRDHRESESEVLCGVRGWVGWVDVGRKMLWGWVKGL